MNLKGLDSLDSDQLVMLKLTIPTQPNLYIRISSTSKMLYVL